MLRKSTTFAILNHFGTPPFFHAAFGWNEVFFLLLRSHFFVRIMAFIKYKGTECANKKYTKKIRLTSLPFSLYVDTKSLDRVTWFMNAHKRTVDKYHLNNWFKFFLPWKVHIENLDSNSSILVWLSFSCLLEFKLYKY